MSEEDRYERLGRALEKVTLAEQKADSIRQRWEAFKKSLSSLCSFGLESFRYKDGKLVATPPGSVSSGESYTEVPWFPDHPEVESLLKELSEAEAAVSHATAMLERLKGDAWSTRNC